MTPSPTNKRDNAEKTVPIRKKDLETAIKEGLISLDVGTILWRKWRQKRGDSTLATVPSGQIEWFSEKRIAYAAALVFLAGGLLSLLMLIWGYFGIVGIEIACLFFTSILAYSSMQLNVNGKHIERNLCALSSILFAILLIYTLGIHLDISLLIAKPKVDVFGVVPSHGYERTIIFSTISILMLALYNSQFSAALFKYCIWVCVAVLLDSLICLTVGGYMERSSVQAFSITVILTGALCYLRFFGEDSEASAQIRLAQEGKLLMASLVVTFICTTDNQVSPYFLFLISVSAYVFSILRSIQMVKTASILFIATSSLMLLWDGVGSIFSTALFFIFSLGAFFYLRNTSRIEAFGIKLLATHKNKSKNN